MKKIVFLMFCTMLVFSFASHDGYAKETQEDECACQNTDAREQEKVKAGGESKERTSTPAAAQEN